MALPPTSLSNVHQSRVHEPHPDSAPHPFGKELEQVNEVVEEFGGVIPDEEEQVLLAKGLKKFAVEDYIYEIQDLYSLYIGGVSTMRHHEGSTWI